MQRMWLFNNATDRPDLSKKEKYFFCETQVVWAESEGECVIEWSDAVLTNPYPGPVSYISIFQQNVDVYRCLLHEPNSELSMVDAEFFGGSRTLEWMMTCDKGYRGASEIIRSIYPFKKSHNQMLSTVHSTFNDHRSSDRVIFENCFGRLTTFLSILSHKCRWSQKKCGGIFK